MWTHIQQMREVDGRQDQRRSPEDHEPRHSLQGHDTRRPHSAHRACAVELAARPVLLES